MENDERSPPQRRRIPVVIPCSIPWESRPCLQNQCGMSAFGSCRNAVLKTAVSNEQASSQSHNNDPFLSLFASTNVGASQKGMRSFGAHRENVSKPTSSKQFSHDKAKITETIIPKQSIGSVASQLHLSAPIGSPRQHVMRIDSAAGQKMDPMSNTFLTKSAAPNPNSHAGTSIMDRFRKQVLAADHKSEMHHDRQTESLLPKWSDRSGLVSPSGTGAGVSGLGPHRSISSPTHLFKAQRTSSIYSTSKKSINA
ncbi:Protein unc-87 [Trichinella pseudospiralis]